MRCSSFSNYIFIKSLRISYKYTMYFDHIHPNFSTPLILCSCPLSPFTIQDQFVLLCTHAHEASTGDSLTNSPTFKENRLFKNHQLSIALQLEVGVYHEPLPSSCWDGDCLDLVQSSPANPSSCEVLSTTVLPHPRDTDQLQPSISALVLTLFLPTSSSMDPESQGRN